MTTEERTRSIVIEALATIADALRLILQEREAKEETTKVLDKLASGENPGIPEHPVDTPTITKIKKERAKKEKPPVISTAAPAEVAPTMADIKPTKPGKTLEDLRIALQECINKHGMPAAKERLAPHTKISAVPDEDIANVIERLAAE